MKSIIKEKISIFISAAMARIKAVDLHFTQWKRSRHIFLLTVLLMLLILGVAFTWTPNKVRYYYPQEDDLVQTLYVSDITDTLYCTVDENGVITSTGEDDDGSTNYIIFEGLDTDAMTVAIYFTEKLDVMMDVSVRMYTAEEYDVELFADQLKYEVYMEVEDEDGEDTELRTVGAWQRVFNYTDVASVTTEGLGQYNVLVICVDSTNAIDRIELHSEESLAVDSLYHKSLLRFIVGLCVGFAAWVLVLIAELLFDFSSRLMPWIVSKWSWKKFLVYITATGITSGLGALISLGLSSGTMDKQLWLFAWTILLCLVILFFFVVKKYFTAEGAYFLLFMVIGISMVWQIPMGLFSWDEHEHYASVLSTSVIVGSAGYTTADINELYVNTVYNSYGYEGNMARANADGIYVSGYTLPDFYLWFLPAATAQALARLFCLKYVWRFCLGRMAQVLFYAICIYLAMRRLKSGKMILGVIAAFPTTMFLASNYSRDYWMLALGVLGVAVAVGICQRHEDKIPYKEIALSCIIIIFSCLIKKNYLPMVFFPLIILLKKVDFSKKKLNLSGKRKWYLIGGVLAIALVLVVLATQTVDIVTGIGDLRGGSAVNPAKQVAYILQNPDKFWAMIIPACLSYINPIVSEFAMHWGYIGTSVGVWVVTLLLGFVTLTDKADCDKGAYSPAMKAFSILNLLAGVFILHVLFYVVFTEVGEDCIEGCQYRYILPFIYPLCAVIAGRGIRLKRVPERVYQAVVMVISFGVVVYNIYYLMM